VFIFVFSDNTLQTARSSSSLSSFRLRAQRATTPAVASPVDSWTLVLYVPRSS